MSFPPSPYLVKLQDLKLWQSNYDNLLKTKNDATHPSDFDTIEGLSALDSPDLTPHISPRRAFIDYDKKVLTPARPFEQLLEERLAEEQPVNVQEKAKKPFLRKGSGLSRYNLVPKPLTYKKPKSCALKRETIQESSGACLQNCNNDNREFQQNLTPLKAPDFAIRSKTTWVKAGDEETEENSAVVESKDSPKSEPNSKGFHTDIISKINEFALKHFLPASPRRWTKDLCDPNSCNIQSKANCDNVRDCDSLNTTEKELRLFEALEDRAENTSFSSTNSSIMKLLSSTPNKITNPRTTVQENPRNSEFSGNRKLAQTLKEVNAKSDVLSNFLHNLKKMSKDNCAEKPGKENRHCPSDDSLSEEEEKSSSNADTRNDSPSSLYTDFEHTFRETAKADAAVNTSDLEESSRDKDCARCEELRESLNELKKQVPDIQAEKAKVCDFAKDLEKKRDQLSREIDKLRKKYDKDVGELQEELDGEKKKLAREKSIFDMYMKEAQNRPSKKEREEISGLRKELADIRELLKLKDAKNGATQARLRNQIKQLEKERAELKAAVDGLRKENSKLNAMQKVRRPAESKLLHEINRNLSKLTEESLKGQLNKSDSGGNADGSLEEVKKGRRKSTGDATRMPDKEINPPKLNRKPLPNFKRRLSEDRECVVERADEIAVEKQYENTFGQSDETAASVDMNESKEGTKTTRVFPDGSKETKYSNGSWKTVSPDGQLIIFKYYNGDIKETNMKACTVRYYFAESSTWNTEFPDGSELVEYANGQKERKYKDGKIEVECPDGRLLTRLPDGSDEISYPDGSKILQTVDGEKIVVFPNGQKEFHTKDHKRREYPDGTVKFIYPDGTRETRYGSGRIRIKDSNNVLIMDSHAS